MKKILSTILIACLVFATGCQQSAASETYNKESASFYFLEGTVNRSDRFAADLAVIPKISNLEGDFKKSVNSALLINNTTNEILIATNPHAKIYPASLTKMMTALLTLKHTKMDEIVTVDRDIVFYESGVKVIYLKKGDKVSVKDLFHGLLVTSANDCGVVLANYISGSEAEFAKQMTKESKAIGATNTKYMNSHGLHHDQHYTTAYDLYLLLREVGKYDEFIEAVGLKNYTMTYTNSSGNTVNKVVETTNMYIDGSYPVPDKVVMLGGKTGTTAAAGSCLVLLTKNEKNEEFISVVTGATDKEVLYDAMTNLLSRENK